MTTEVTALEVQNAQKVLKMLGDIDDIGYCQVREDIFVVSEYETGADLEITVDVEESTVVLLMEIGDIKNDSYILFRYLLEVNNEAVHGKFCLDGNKLLIKDVLEFENLDLNELEAAIEHMFVIVAKHGDKIGDMLA